MEATFFSILNSRHCESTEVKVLEERDYHGARRGENCTELKVPVERDYVPKVLSRWLYRLDTCVRAYVHTAEAYCPNADA